MYCTIHQVSFDESNNKQKDYGLENLLHYFYFCVYRRVR